MEIIERFEREEPDPTFRPERSLTQKLLSVLPRGSSMLDLECRKTMCRLETQHLDASAYSSFVNAFDPESAEAPSEPPWSGSAQFISIPSDDDDVIAVAFLVRDGYDLPEAPRPSAEQHQRAKQDMPSGLDAAGGR